MTPPALELWGGVECTVARVRDRFRDQSAETGHRDRPSDLDAIAALGIRTLRYPVIWETVAPDGAASADWSWHDARLAQLRELGIRPIAGLVHHGSGPRDTNLLDPNFPRRLARHAERVARRYPWIEDFTPVNEPLTTARFSALYGHWYPHQTNYRTFLLALVHECRATVLAMRAIRRITPAARLIQTDDIGRTFSTPPLAYQAEHENGRRWLAFDLLCGRVDRTHPWWRILRDNGIAEQALSFFLDGEGAPDIIGMNHYLTSERFLDHRLDLYPAHFRGGNHRQAYADVEAVRMPLPDALGPAARLRETWQRYGRPVAVTEVHHGCTRDEQLRWLADVWRAAETVRAEGADIRAVTLWSLFGAVDWSSLLTENRGIYEPGAFDIRGERPRPTALAHAARAITRTGCFDHPVLDGPGWWRRSSRFYAEEARSTTMAPPPRSARPILITGANGPLGLAVSHICGLRGLDHVSVAEEDLVAETGAVAALLDRHRPWAVIDAASLVRVDEPDNPSAQPTHRPDEAAALAQACAARDIALVAFSSDLVFGGRLGRACRESDAADTGLPEGNLQAQSDAASLAMHPGALVVRAGPLFGPWDRHDPLWSMLRRWSSGLLVEATDDLISPTYIPDLVHVALDLMIDGESGLWHLANPGCVSWYDLARDAAARAGFGAASVVLRARAEGALNSALATERSALLPPLASALDRFFAETDRRWAGSDGLGVAAA